MARTRARRRVAAAICSRPRRLWSLQQVTRSARSISSASSRPPPWRRGGRGGLRPGPRCSARFTIRLASSVVEVEEDRGLRRGQRRQEGARLVVADHHQGRIERAHQLADLGHHRLGDDPGERVGAVGDSTRNRSSSAPPLHHGRRLVGQRVDGGGEIHRWPRSPRRRRAGGGGPRPRAGAERPGAASRASWKPVRTGVGVSLNISSAHPGPPAGLAAPSARQEEGPGSSASATGQPALGSTSWTGSRRDSSSCMSVKVSSSRVRPRRRGSVGSGAGTVGLRSPHHQEARSTSRARNGPTAASTSTPSASNAARRSAAMASVSTWSPASGVEILTRRHPGRRSRCRCRGR